MASLRKLTEFLGLNRSLVGLLAMAVLVGMGERLAERFLPIYIIALGGGAWAIGGLNGLDNLLSALYAFPGGYLSDRIGAKRALLVFNLIAMTGYVIVILVPAWQAVLVGALFFLSWSAISLPATMDLVAKSLPLSKRTMGVSMHSLVRRIPMGLGPIIGGLFIAAFGEVQGVRMAFGCAIVLAGVALILQQRLITPDQSNAELAVPQTEKHPWRLIRGMQPALRNLLVADILVRYCEQIPYAFAVVWCMKRVTSPVSAVEFGVLTAIEMSTAMLIYVPVAYLADRHRKKPFVVMTFAFFTLFPLALWAAPSFGWLALAFIVRGLKEFGEPTRKSLILDLAPEGRKASTFGVYYLVRDSIVSIAAFGGAYLWLISPTVNFLTATGFGLLGTVWFALLGKDRSEDSST